MKKKILVVLVALTLVCSLLFSNVVTAFAAESTVYYLTDGDDSITLTLEDESKFLYVKTFDNGDVWNFSGEYVQENDKINFLYNGATMLTATVEDDGSWTFDGLTVVDKPTTPENSDDGASGETQEPTKPQNPTNPDNSNTEEITMTKEELEQYIFGVLDKATANMDPDSYFKQTILPIIASALATLIITALFLFVPYMRNRARRKQVEGYAQALQEDKANLTALLKATDAPAIKNSLAELYGEYLKKSMEQFKEEFGPYLQTFASMKTTIDTEYAQLKTLVSAATLAWSSRPEVTALLTESPEKSTLDKKTEEIEALRAYIKQIKGDEADAIIKKLEVE